MECIPSAHLDYAFDKVQTPPLLKSNCVSKKKIKHGITNPLSLSLSLSLFLSLSLSLSLSLLPLPPLPPTPQCHTLKNTKAVDLEDVFFVTNSLKKNR